MGVHASCLVFYISKSVTLRDDPTEYAFEDHPSVNHTYSWTHVLAVRLTHPQNSSLNGLWDKKKESSWKGVDELLKTLGVWVKLPNNVGSGSSWEDSLEIQET